MTLQEQWDALISKVNVLADNWMGKYCRPHPVVFYHVNLYTGRVEEKRVLGLEYRFEFDTWPSGKKPSKKDIATLAAHANLPIDFDQKNVCFKTESDYYIGADKFRSTSGFNFLEYHKEEGKTTFMVEEDAQAIGKPIRDKREAEKAFRKLHAKPYNYDFRSNGYTLLGYMNGWKGVSLDKDGNPTDNYRERVAEIYPGQPLYMECRKQEHTIVENPDPTHRGNNIYSCPVCKIMYRVDSGD